MFEVEWEDESDQEIFIVIYDGDGEIDRVDNAKIKEFEMNFVTEDALNIVISTIQKISSSESSYE